MNFNLIKIRLKIMFYLIFGKISKQTAKIELPNHKNVKDVVIFFPADEKAFRIAMYSFREFDFFKKNLNFYFVINQKFEHLIKLNATNLIFMQFHKSKISFCNLKDEDILINEKKDMLIDLNTNFNFELCKMIDSIDSNYKIGFKNKYSDYFFNLQLDTFSNDITENSFNRIKQILM